MNIYQEIREYLETIYPEVRHYSDSLFRQIYKCKVPGKRKMDVIEAGARAIVYNGKKIGSNLDDLKKFFGGTVTESLSLDEAKEVLKQHGFIVESDMSVEDKILNAKSFNAIDDVVKVYKKIMALDGTKGWDIPEEERRNYFTLDELTDAHLTKVAQRNKGYTTVIVGARKELNEYRDFVEIELCLSSKGFPLIRVSVNDGKKTKTFDVTEFDVAIKYANWVK